MLDHSNKTHWRADGLAAVFLTALTLRAVWLGAMMTEHHSNDVWYMTPDTCRYTMMATHFQGLPYDGPPLHDLGRPAYGSGEGAVMWSGPGYGGFVAGMRTLCGSAVWPLLGLQVLISSLTCVLIALLAPALGLPRRCGLLAGMIAALSLTSISLSSMVLTETLMVALHVGGLLCLVWGWRSGGWTRFILADVLFGAGALVRPIAQPWPAVMCLLPLAIPATWLAESRRRTLAATLVSALLACAITGGWMARNQARHGVWSLSEAGHLSARFWVAARVVAGTDPQRTTADVWRSWLEAERRIDGPAGASLAEYHRRDKAGVLTALQEHPLKMAKRITKNTLANIVTGSELHPAQLPRLSGLWTMLEPLLHARAGSAIFLICALSACGLLWFRDTRLAGVVLVVTYAYFMGLSGLSSWQGSRFHFVAQMAWANLLAVPLHCIWTWVASTRARPTTAGSPSPSS